MSEERNNRQGFFSRVFREQQEEGGDGAPVYSRGDVGAGDREMSPHSRAFTVERAAQVIKNLPPEVPRPAAVRIVRQTLEAAGIDIEELDASTRTREAKLESEIDLSEDRIRKLKDDTEDVIRNLEDQIRKAREARNFGVAEEERKIEAAETGLEDIDMVRGFFGLSAEEDGEQAQPARPSDEPAAGEETRIIEAPADDDTQVLRQPGPLSDSEEYWNTRDDRNR